MSCGAAGAALCCDGGKSQGLLIALDAAQLDSWIARATAQTHQIIYTLLNQVQPAFRWGTKATRKSGLTSQIPITESLACREMVITLLQTCRRVWILIRHAGECQFHSSVARVTNLLKRCVQR